MSRNIKLIQPIAYVALGTAIVPNVSLTPSEAKTWFGPKWRTGMAEIRGYRILNDRGRNRLVLRSQS